MKWKFKVDARRWSLKSMFESKSRIDFWKTCLKLKRTAELVTMWPPHSVCNVTLAFKSLPIQSKVGLQMLLKLIAAAKESWACLCPKVPREGECPARIGQCPSFSFLRTSNVPSMSILSCKLYFRNELKVLKVTNCALLCC